MSNDKNSSEREKEITIYDIAKMAGVSPATVSRVLTKNTRVSPKKKEIVEGLIKEYNFRPNALARGLSDTRTMMIGIAVADIRNPYYATLAVACEKAAYKKGYNIVLSNILQDHEKERKILENFYEHRVAAIIQIGSLTDDLVTDPQYASRVQELIKTTPYVTTGNLENTDCYRVSIDSKMAMAITMDYLVSLGHSEIAFIGGKNTVLSTYQKWQQYIYMLGKHELPFREEYVQDGNYSISGGKDCMEAIFKGEHQPTAVITINDYTAVGAAKVIQEKGLLIPDDISLVSFDNTFLAEITTPMMTSVDYDYDYYGERLVSVAIDASLGKNIAHDWRITPSLVIRESSGKPRG